MAVGVSSDWTSEPDAAGVAVAFPISEQVCVVLGNRPVAAGYWHLELDAPSPACQARPGQFFHLLCPSPDERTTPFFRRPMSVYGADANAARVEFLYKVTGGGTRGLATLQVGDALNMVGPLGRGFHLDPAGRHILILARGVGLATLAPLVQLAKLQGMAVTAVLSARTTDHLLSVARMHRHGADVITVTDADGSSDPDHVEALLRPLFAAGRLDAVFTCGSNRLLLLLKRLAKAHGVPGQVALEQQMACGLGMCFCCVRVFDEADGTAYRRVCCDGPVFDLQTVPAW